MSAVEVDDLRRVFRAGRRRRWRRESAGPARPEAVVALDGLSLRIEHGELHGLLGPNGAGKTTLVKILTTVLLPTSGTVRVLGHDVVRYAALVRPRIGLVLGGERGLYNRLSARKNLQFWAALYGLTDAAARLRVGELLDRLGLSARADDTVETYSRGMKQRLHLARGLIGDPEVLFLDEPTIGLDPVGAADVRRLVADIRAEGRTILLTTHDMAEAEELCDRVTLVDHGTVLATEAPQQLAARLSRGERIDVDDLPGGMADALAQLPGVTGVTTEGRASRIHVADSAATQAALTALIGAGVTSIRTTRPSLEEVYVQVVGDRGLEV
jgi:ABC-2 type transport system ATP-binding protein